MSKITFLSIGRLDPNPAWRMPGDRHAFHELIVARAGAMRVHGPRGETWALRAGECALYPAGAWHMEISDADDPLASLYLAFHAPLPETEVTIRPDRRGRLAGLAAWMWEERMQEGPAERAWRGHCLELLLAEWRLLGLRADADDPVVDETRRWLARHVGERHTLADLARRAGLSKSHFLARFRRRCGVTPMAYLARLRCREAERLLRYSALPLKEIAVQTGFADPYHFSKRFKRHAGVAPSALRGRVQ